MYECSHSITLPEVYDDVMNETVLLQYMQDIKQCTQVLNVIAKRFSTTFSEEQLLTLQKAIQLIKDKSVRGIQIRYKYQGKEWWDTILCQPNGYRIVRLCQSDLINKNKRKHS